jgi:hypothetical protein
MSMDLQSRVRVISRLPGPWDGQAMTLEKPKVDSDVNTWDRIVETLWVPRVPWLLPGDRRDQELLPAVGNAVLVVQNERVVGVKAGFPVVEIESLGILGDKPWKATLTQDTTGEIGTSGLLRNFPTVTVAWFSKTLEGVKAYVPWTSVPPETFGFQALAGDNTLTPWQGWVHSRRDVDALAVRTGSAPGPWKSTTINGGGTRPDAATTPRPTLCAVVDTYIYVPANTLPPND